MHGTTADRHGHGWHETRRHASSQRGLSMRYRADTCLSGTLGAAVRELRRRGGLGGRWEAFVDASCGIEGDWMWLQNELPERNDVVEDEWRDAVVVP
jgi:hypothetical protein